MAQLRSRRGILAAAFSGCLIAVAMADTNLLAPDKRLHVISDPRSGVAIFGYDPVAFHFERRSIAGLPIHEVEIDGKFWRFSKAANKAAFEADPVIYMPMFGGYDALSVGEGLLVKGDPEFFLIVGGETVFFRNAENRDRYAADADLRRRAVAGWPAVVRQHMWH